MTPSLPLPTDNVYKFVCLFGLTLVGVGVFSFLSSYSPSLERAVRYSEAVISLEAKPERTAAEEELLAMNKKLIEIAKANEVAALDAIGKVVGLGIVLSLGGAYLWYTKIQLRDDQLARLQLEKVELEVTKLRIDVEQASKLQSEAATGGPASSVTREASDETFVK